jgi:hypothetical protein
VALIIFGALGDGRDFMPDWEHNYLSWSFGLAFVGAVFNYVRTHHIFSRILNFIFVIGFFEKNIVL